MSHTWTLIQTGVMIQTRLMNHIGHIRISLTSVMIRSRTWDMCQTIDMSQTEGMC
jgi:hypothetical protein